MNAQTNVPSWSARFRVAVAAFIVAMVGVVALGNVPEPALSKTDVRSGDATAKFDIYADTLMEVELTRPARGYASNSFRHGYFEFEDDPVEEIAD